MGEKLHRGRAALMMSSEEGTLDVMLGKVGWNASASVGHL